MIINRKGNSVSNPNGFLDRKISNKTQNIKIKLSLDQAINQFVFMGSEDFKLPICSTTQSVNGVSNHMKEQLNTLKIYQRIKS